MNDKVMLTVTSLLSALLFLVHWADDIVRGLDTVKPSNVGGLLILAVWLYGPLVLPERRSGLVIALFMAPRNEKWLHFGGQRTNAGHPVV